MLGFVGRELMAGVSSRWLATHTCRELTAEYHPVVSSHGSRRELMAAAVSSSGGCELMVANIYIYSRVGYGAHLQPVTVKRAVYQVIVYA